MTQRAWELGVGRWVVSVVVIVLTLWPGPRVSGQESAVRMVADEGRREILAALAGTVGTGRRGWNRRRHLVRPRRAWCGKH